MSFKRITFILSCLSSYDYDIAIEELRSLESEKIITDSEYNYIVNNYDKIIKEVK